MSKKKLTLSVEERLSKRAKAIAEERGTSVSRLVETFFTALEERHEVEGPVDEQKAEGRPGGNGDEGKQGEDRLGPQLLSDWARRWRGAFRDPDRSYPDDPSWDTQVIAEEIEEKHT